MSENNKRRFEELSSLSSISSSSESDNSSDDEPDIVISRHIHSTQSNHSSYTSQEKERGLTQKCPGFL